MAKEPDAVVTAEPRPGKAEAAGGLDLLLRAPGQSTRAWIYQVLRENIIHLHLRPGQALSEAEIGRRLRVSRTPVREAFIRLAEDGLLEVHPQRGSYVSLIDPGRASEARFLRSVAEKAILKEACRAFPERSLFELNANVEMQRFCRRERNYEKMFQLDNEFHAILFRGCGKERLWVHLKKFDSDLDRLRMLKLSAKYDWSGIVGHHERIARLVGTRKPGLVDAVMDEHLDPGHLEKLIEQYREYIRR
jgi:DNA-binding GntR family transcriptional regulator